MTKDEFRHLALSFAGAVEAAHMNHPDFRVAGKIFATLGPESADWGMVKLTPEQQRGFMQTAPGVFTPSSGAWGLKGATQVDLSVATENVLYPALEAAWRNIMAASKKGYSASFFPNP
jgi:hypothetical protein